MRIVYDQQIFGWQAYGGISRYFCELSERIGAMDGSDTDIVAPLYINRYLKSGTAYRLHGRRAPQLPQCGRIYRALSARAVTRKLHGLSPDIVHETYYRGTAYPATGARHIITVHDMIHERFPHQFSRWSVTASDKTRAARRADHIICVSEATRRDLSELLEVSPEKVSVIHHGCSLAEPSRQVALPAKPYLLFVGLRGGYKNFAGLLRAYTASRALQRDFCIVCFGGGDFTADERKLWRRLGVSDAALVHYSGGDAVLSALYHNASMMVYPSKYEGFGMPPLEAMLAGCPVAASNRSAVPEVVGDAAALFDPDDPSQITEAVLRILEQEQWRKALIDRGRVRSRQFSWDACARETLATYQAVVGRDLE